MVNHHDGGYVIRGGHRYERDAWRGRGYMRGAYREPTVIYVQPMAEAPGIGVGLMIAAGLVLGGGLAIWASRR